MKPFSVRSKLDLDARGGSVDLDAEDPGKFPFEAFEYGNLEQEASPKIEVLSPWRLRLTLPVYAGNAAAIAGGLVAGDLYRTGSDPDPVCIVH